MLKAVITATVCFLAISVSHAQSSYSLRGRVVANESKPVPSATILLKRLPDSSLISTTVSDKNGFFAFQNLAGTTYCIAINSMAYKPAIKGPIILKGGQNNAGIITLQPISRNLKDVAVSSRKSFIEVKGSKVILNVKESLVSAGNNAFDILRKAPGVIAQENGELKLNGRTGVQIMVDGKENYLAGEDLAHMLQLIQSSSIESIELISNPGANYTAAGSGGVINIRLIKDKNFGTNGTVGFSAGMGKLGSAYGKNLRATPSISINNRTKHTNIFGNYTYANIAQSRFSVLNRNMVYQGAESSVDVDYFNTLHRQGHSYRAGADYLLDGNNTIGLLISGANSNINIDKHNASDIYSAGQPESRIITNSGQSRKLDNIGFNLNYKAVFGIKKHELSADAEYLSYHRSSLENIFSNTTYFKSKMVPGDGQLRNGSPARYDIKSFKADYLMPFAAGSKLSLGAKTSRVGSHNKLDFGRISGTEYIPNRMLTNQFDFTENIHSFYSTYSKDLKKGTFQAGLRAEYTLSEGTSLTGGNIISKKYLNFFPNLSFSRLINSSNEIWLSYSRRLDRPAYQDLNPFLGYLDQYSYYAGNPLLTPQYSNNLEATHTFKKRYTTTLRYSMTKDAFATVYEQNDGSRMILQKKENLDKMYAFGLVLNAPFKISSWWASNLNVSAMNIHYKSSSNGGTLDNGKPDVTIKALQSLNFNKGFSAEINAKYQSPSFYGIMNYEQILNVDFGLSKSLFAKRGSVKISGSDLFNSDRTVFYSNYQNLDINGNDKAESRIILLSFNWAFGKATLNASRKRNPASETEQSRLGNL